MYIHCAVSWVTVSQAFLSFILSEALGEKALAVRPGEGKLQPVGHMQSVKLLKLTC